MDKKILVAMSGGVDSTVAAWLMKNKGYDIGGITMRVWCDGEDIPEGNINIPDKNCTDARAICDSLNIPHYIVSYTDSFRKHVIDRFIDDYKNGSTPNPCVECNKAIKFGKLFESAISLGYDALATGHYAKVYSCADGRYELRRAADESKDQSYFLWGIRKEILPRVLFPLGEYTKPQIRELAKQNGFSSADRADSQDICFIKDGDYASFIKQQSDIDFPTGNFTDVDGNVIGRHDGIINYTIGQRKGLGIALGQPMFVLEKNSLTNTVTLCTDQQLYRNTLIAKNINILVDEDFSRPVKLQAKIRYRHAPATATVVRLDDDVLSLSFDIPQRAISAGQSLVLYDGDTVVGGGIIQ